MDDAKFNQIMQVFEKAFRDNVPPFQGDLENELYKFII